MQPLSQSRPLPAGRGLTKIDRAPKDPAPSAGLRRQLNGSARGSRRLRIALYSHDTQGLGHMRRNLSIATVLAQSNPTGVILMIAGAREAAAFEMSPGIDCMTLPAFAKKVNGQYRARSLAVSLKTLVALRASSIRAALASLEPDVLIVDKVPLGAFGELKPALSLLRARGRTRIILGLRDVLDDPAVVHREWHLAHSDAVIERFYDAIWIYGDPAVYDLARECAFPAATTAKVRYAGYLGRSLDPKASATDETDILARLELPAGRLVLCLVGGGQDGHRLADAFARCELPPRTSGVVVTGPFMPAAARESLRRVAGSRRRLRVIEFTTRPELLLSAAHSVVAMGGYNTVCELLSLGKRALIVPRVIPRREQLIRAERLQDLGLLDMLHPDRLSPGALTRWLASTDAPACGPRQQIDLDGLARLPGLLAEVLAGSENVADVRRVAAG